MFHLPHVRQAIRWIVARAHLSNERGASAVEYGIMIMLIAAVIILSVVFLGQRSSGSFSCAGTQISTKANVPGCGG